MRDDYEEGKQHKNELLYELGELSQAQRDVRRPGFYITRTSPRKASEKKKEEDAAKFAQISETQRLARPQREIVEALQS